MASTTAASSEYVLGTDDPERDRLRRQHELWLEEAVKGWRAAGVGHGAKVLDIGCGPGLATASLLELVGAEGYVAGLELSPTFVAQARERCAATGLRNAELIEFDVLRSSLPERLRGTFDVAWCRWLAMFLPAPERIVATARDALRPGGTMIFHEYVDYGTYALCPRGDRVREFVDFAIKSFARDGGDAHVARRLPAMLEQGGFAVQSLRPIPRIGRPGDAAWNWPAGFIRVFAPKIVALGLADHAWCSALLEEVAHAERDPGAFFVAPTVLEIIAGKR